ncbi:MULTISPECIES: hypothetical protein [Pseudomonas]|uniref:Thioredoxin-like fold domain-containing protein n=1 Tax=Pseudomonas putida TaxID=303 RepID=A0A1L7NJX0_PSEPU|nr:MULTISPECIES: hypothetical protein [Pseudomonas]MBP2080910.1 hypothetical protein [Pseudomonas sp. PvP089]MBP2087473.1 hypothetical protein [Pseudomonas sp. PvP088]MBP2226207.1 hypothetical protein [Pseudomonas putida]PMY82045.1 hypothetical protein C1X72_06490 [Pseudomonas sp. FW306-2-2C-D06B]BAW25786.1 Uncharacterized protein KF715C_ch52130 [Pseudomonas putida]
MKGVFARPVAVLAALAAGVSVAHAAPAQTADLSAFITAQAVAPATQAQQELDDLTAQRVSRYGRIVNARPVGLGGLTAWTVEKNGHQVVLFSTPDSAVLFTGVAWNAESGANISDAFLPGAAQVANPAPAPAAVAVAPAAPMMSPVVAPNVREAAAMDGSFKGAVPESMKTVDSLAGVKEGKGGIGDTVYIIIDPRCPYCREAYNLTRAYAAKGHSIKWIPSAALGNPEDGVPLAATILQAKDQKTLARVLGKHEQIRSEPSPETVEQLSTNLAFLFAAFENNGKEQAGVPAAFFIDHRTGKPRMMTGLSQAVVLEDIFGKL